VGAVHYAYERSALVDIGSHVFPMEKYGLLAQLIREELQSAPAHWHGWESIADEDLERVHTPGYLRDLSEARPTARTVPSELPVSVEVIDGFRRMAGGSVVAVRLALEHGVGFHIGGGFHHAFPDHAEGFCYLHDMAIAVERLRADEGVGPVLFVDVDVHQGNGTAVIYAEDRETFTYSIHQEKNYPIKQRSDLDRGLDDGIGNRVYLERLRADLKSIESRFSPELVCYVAGVDPHRDDQLGGLGLDDDGIEARDQLVLEHFVGKGIPVAVFLAGGYAPTAERTARLHLACAKAAEEAVAGS